jgi:signal transduction histidine kinase
VGSVNGSIELSVSDDGIGFDPDAPPVGHFGLVGLREQAQLIGADLQIESAPGLGTRVRVRLRVALDGEFTAPSSAR